MAGFRSGVGKNTVSAKSVLWDQKVRTCSKNRGAKTSQKGTGADLEELPMAKGGRI